MYGRGSTMKTIIFVGLAVVSDLVTCCLAEKSNERVADINDPDRKLHKFNLQLNQDMNKGPAALMNEWETRDNDDDDDEIHVERRQGFPSTGRILSGHQVDIVQFPWICAVINVQGHLCGGSILTPQMILTAAHCLHGRNISDIYIRCGSTSLLSGGSVSFVDGSWTDPQFNPTTYENDIALMHLSSPMSYTDKIKPVAVTDQPAVAGTSCVVAGWGQTEEGGSISQQLRKVNVSFITYEKCRSESSYYYIGPSQVCAGEPGKDACAGDSGGPLICGNFQYGISSWGWGCGRQGYPGIYTNLPAYYTLIKSIQG